MPLAPLLAVVRFVRRSGKRIAVTIVGFALVAVGIVLLVFPGPGILVIIAGLAVLGTQYAWAQRALEETKRRARAAAKKVRRKKV